MLNHSVSEAFAARDPQDTHVSPVARATGAPESRVGWVEVTHIGPASGFYNSVALTGLSQVVEGGYVTLDPRVGAFVEPDYNSGTYASVRFGSYFDVISSLEVKEVAFRSTSAHLDERRLRRAPLLERITEFQSRQKNWDGDDGVAPNKQAVLDARRFVRSLPNDCPLPDRVYAPGDGEVLFQWRRADTFAEVGFFGDNIASWCVKPKDEPASYDDEPINGVAPERLLAALKPL
jgi:hypothetical protein